MFAHRAHVGLPNVDSGRHLFRNTCRAGSEKLLCTALLGYPAAISAALERAKIIFAQPRPEAEVYLVNIVPRKQTQKPDPVLLTTGRRESHG
jgi:hypothetical protein